MRVMMTMSEKEIKGQEGKKNGKTRRQRKFM